MNLKKTATVSISIVMITLATAFLINANLTTSRTYEFGNITIEHTSSKYIITENGSEYLEIIPSINLKDGRGLATKDDIKEIHLTLFPLGFDSEEINWDDTRFSTPNGYVFRMDDLIADGFVLDVNGTINEKNRELVVIIRQLPDIRGEEFVNLTGNDYRIKSELKDEVCQKVGLLTICQESSIIIPAPHLKK